MILENFIVFEGIDGAGTTTQLNILKKKCGSNFLFTAEPSRSPVGKFLRSMLGGNVPVTNETAAYLFAAFCRRSVCQNAQNLSPFSLNCMIIH